MIMQQRGNNNTVLVLHIYTGNRLEVIMREFNINNVLLRHTDRRYVSFDSLDVNQVKDELWSRHLSTKGKKAELISRLKGHLENPQTQVNQQACFKKS